MIHCHRCAQPCLNCHCRGCDVLMQVLFVELQLNGNENRTFYGVFKGDVQRQQLLVGTSLAVSDICKYSSICEVSPIVGIKV
jgi:hypothetical protein